MSIEENTVYHLSRNFMQYSYETEMPAVEVSIKSPIALALGILPFAVAKLAMVLFKGSAFLTEVLDKQIEESKLPARAILFGGMRTLTAVSGVTFASLMMCASKLFSLSQKIVWGGYVEKPSGAGPNQRLAQYGAGGQPWEDLTTIAYAFFSPQSLPSSEWKLKQWSQIII